MAGDDGLVGRLEDHVVPVERTASGGGMEDLKPLADVFADRRVVGFGEATHGTKEFFQLKHRLVRFLVTELDFRLFGLEANFSETLAIDDYVVSGEGDPEAALDGIYFWTWNTEEMLALIEWLRRYNEGQPLAEKVRFYGFDCQYTRGPARALGTFFERVDADYLDEIEDGIRLLASGRVGDDPDELAMAATVAADPKARLADREDAYRSATDKVPDDASNKTRTAALPYEVQNNFMGGTRVVSPCVRARVR